MTELAQLTRFKSDLRKPGGKVVHRWMKEAVAPRARCRAADFGPVMYNKTATVS